MLFFFLSIIFFTLLPCVVLLVIINAFLEKDNKLPILIIAPFSLLIGITIFIVLMTIFQLSLDMGSLSIPVPLSVLTVLSLLITIPLYKKTIAKTELAEKHSKVHATTEKPKLVLKGILIGSLSSVLAMIAAIFILMAINFYSGAPDGLPFFERLSYALGLALRFSILSIVLVPLGFLIWGLPTHFILNRIGTTHIVGYVVSAVVGTYLILGTQLFIVTGIIGAIVFWFFGVRRYS